MPPTETATSSGAWSANRASGTASRSAATSMSGAPIRAGRFPKKAGWVDRGAVSKQVRARPNPGDRKAQAHSRALVLDDGSPAAGWLGGQGLQVLPLQRAGDGGAGGDGMGGLPALDHRRRLRAG